MLWRPGCVRCSSWVMRNSCGWLGIPKLLHTRCQSFGDRITRVRFCDASLCRDGLPQRDHPDLARISAVAYRLRRKRMKSGRSVEWHSACLPTVRAERSASGDEVTTTEQLDEEPTNVQ